MRARSNDCSEQGVSWQDDATRTGGGKTFNAVGLTAIAGPKVIPAVEKEEPRKEKEKGGEGGGKERVMLGWQEGMRASSIYQHPRYHHRHEQHLSRAHYNITNLATGKYTPNNEQTPATRDTKGKRCIVDTNEEKL